MKQIKFRLFLPFFPALILASCLPAGFKGSKYSDVQGRFSLRVNEKLILQAATPSYVHWQMSDPPVDAYLTMVEAESLNAAVRESLATLQYAADRFKVTAARDSLGNWTLQQYQDAQGTGVAVAGQKRGSTFYLLMAVGSVDVVQPSPPQSVMGMLLTLKFTEKVAAAFHPESIAELESYLDERAQRTGGSISLAVIRNREIVYTYVTGYADGLNRVPANRQTVYHWLSITKLVTATAVMQLAESGQIDLDAPLYRYIPEIPQELNFTVRQALNHSSGLPEGEGATYLVRLVGEPAFDLQAEAEKYLRSINGFTYEPGSQAKYTNYEFLLLGLLIEKVSGLKYTDYVREHILEPLGMVATAFDYQPGKNLESAAYPVYSKEHINTLLTDLSQGRESADAACILRSVGEFAWLEHVIILAPWGGLIGSPLEATAFMGLHLNKGSWQGKRILKPESVRAMQKMQEDTAGNPLGFGLGWSVEGRGKNRIVSHGGGGPGGESALFLYPKRNLGIMVMGNMNNLGPDTIARFVADLFG